MFRKTLLAAVSALALLPVAATAAITVKDVNVEADLSAIANEQAATYWTNIASDIETAVVERLVGRIDDDGANITIRIREVALANAFQTQLGLEEPVLAGRVIVSSERADGGNDVYDLTITIQAAQTMLPEGVDRAVPFAPTAEYYRAMVNAFADNVVQRLN